MSPLWGDLVAVILTLVPLAAVIRTVLRRVVVAAPDEWLLHLRRGRLLAAGVGITRFRRPGDQVARFTSTVQRVRFNVEVLSSEQVAVEVEGFVLWSVSAHGDGPFIAFQKLGLHDLQRPKAGQHRQHLLTTPQHRAFRQLLMAALSRRAATIPVQSLLDGQQRLVTELGEDLETLEDDMGLRVERIELLRVRPTDADMLSHLSTAVSEAARLEHATVRLETDARVEASRIEREVEVTRLRTAQELGALEERQAVRHREVEQTHQLRLRELELEHEVASTEQAQRIRREEREAEHEEANLVRKLDRMKREAEAQRDAQMALNEVDEVKSDGLRAHERARWVAQHAGEAMKGIHDARWVSVGDSPWHSLAAVVAAAVDDRSS